MRGITQIVCWFPKESPDGLTNGKMPSTGTAVASSAYANEMKRASPETNVTEYRYCH